MAYVDLNPLRAKMAPTPEASDFTSVQRRTLCLKSAVGESSALQPEGLLPFVGKPREFMPDGLPFKLEDYLELIDWSGRIVREGKRGTISVNIPAILQRLGISIEIWQRLSQQFSNKSSSCFGCANIARQLKCHFGLKRLRLSG